MAKLKMMANQLHKFVFIVIFILSKIVVVFADYTEVQKIIQPVYWLKQHIRRTQDLNSETVARISVRLTQDFTDIHRYSLW